MLTCAAHIKYYGEKIMAYKKEQKSFISEDKTTEIIYYTYTPDVTPKAVFQIVHGMCDRVENYEVFAEYLCEKGIVVCGADLRGHGRTAKNEDELGWFGSKKGYEWLESDAESLRLIMRSKYKRLPYIFFGSGMGELIVRSYIKEHGTDIDGAVLWESFCATDSLKKAVNSTGFKMLFNNGSKRDESAVKNAMNALGIKMKEGADSVGEACGFVPTVAALNGLLRLCMKVSSLEWYNEIPKSLPIFVIGGNESGVKGVYDAFEDSEINNLSMKYYEDLGYRLYGAAKECEAFDDIHAWCDEVIEGVVECMKLN